MKNKKSLFLKKIKKAVRRRLRRQKMSQISQGNMKGLVKATLERYRELALEQIAKEQKEME